MFQNLDRGCPRAFPSVFLSACRPLPPPLPPASLPRSQAELDNGASIAALRRFNDNLAALPAHSWGALKGHRLLGSTEGRERSLA